MKLLMLARSFSAICFGIMTLALSEYGAHPVIIIGLVLSIADYVISSLLIRNRKPLELDWEIKFYG